MDTREHPVLSCDTLNAVASVAHMNLQTPTLTLKQEIVKCIDEEESPCRETVYTSEPLKSPEYVNFYDSNSYVLEQPKRDSHDVACLLQSGCSLNNKVVSGNLEFKLVNEQDVKHENTKEGMSLNIKQEDENTEYQIEIKTEMIEQQGIWDNAEDNLLLTPQDIQYNFAQKTLNNSDLLRPIKESVKVEINTHGDNETNALYQCQYCDKNFDDHSCMLIHISKVHREKNPKCLLCGYQFKTLWNLKRHVRVHRLQSSSNQVTRNDIECKYCNLHFINQYRLKKHMELCYCRKEDGRSGYTCVACEAVYKSKGRLTKHIKTIHCMQGHDPNIQNANGKFICDICQKIFSVKASLDVHIKRLHYDYGRMFECWCGKEFRSPIDLRMHKSLKHKRKIQNTNVKFQCDYCQKMFKGKRSLIIHIKRMHYDYGRMFECWCGKQFRSPIDLGIHKKYKQVYKRNNQNKNPKFQCDYCKKFYKTKTSLVFHIKRLHYDYGRTFECWCGERFISPIPLRAHKLRHDREIQETNDKFQCDYCQKFYKTKNSLIFHIKRYHYDYGRTFECWCGIQFRSPIRLREHKQQHEPKIKKRNDKFQCDSCQKIFKAKQSLSIHIMRDHYDYGKVFECWCGKQYRSPIQLKKHKQTNHALSFGGYKFVL